MFSLEAATLLVVSTLSAVSATLMLRGAFAARTAAGLAGAMLLMNLVIHPFWFAYAAAHQNWLMLATSTLWVAVVGAWWGFRLTDHGRRFWFAAAGLTGWTAVATLAAVTVVPADALGWIAGAVGVVSTLPQLIALYRADRLDAGFNVSAWTFSLVSLTGWVAYGALSWQLPVLVPDIVALVVLLAIVARARALAPASGSLKVERSTAQAGLAYAS